MTHAYTSAYFVDGKEVSRSVAYDTFMARIDLDNGTWFYPEAMARRLWIDAHDEGDEKAMSKLMAVGISLAI